MLPQLDSPRGHPQALLVVVLLAVVLYRHWLVLVLLAAPPTAGAAGAGVEEIVSRVVDRQLRQRLVLELLAPSPGHCLVQTTFHCCQHCRSQC